MKIHTAVILMLSFVAVSAYAKDEARKVASTGMPCTTAQVMRTVHADRANSKIEYGQNGAPGQRQNENNDQYFFRVDDEGRNFQAIVTYDSGSCVGGVAVIKP